MKSATVIRHIAFEDLGTLEIALEKQGYIIKYLEAGVDNLADIAPLAEDMLIVLGGPIGAYDEEDYPFLVDEIRLLEQRLKADLPTLGICLGAQLMARALGARVYPGGEKEIGWSNIKLSDAGKYSPLVHLDTEQTPVLHWHGDTFDLPTGATHLASSRLYQNQAFSWGKACMGLQFHPEVTVSGLERWFIGHASEINATPNVSVKQLRADTANYGEILQEKAVGVWINWLESVQLVR
ncbi:MAG: glutamine amidotransferase [Cyanobacteria bacterium P01_D01_bin.50]